MIIFSSNIPSINKFDNNKQISAKPSFGSRLPNRVYDNAKSIPNLRCASCDEVMLTYKQTLDIQEKFKAPAKEALSREVFNEYKDTRAYKYILSIVKNYPGKTLDSLLSINQVKKDINNFKPKEKTEMGKIARLAREQYVKSSSFIKKLDKYSHSFKDQYKELYDILRVYANKYPQETFSEIFKKPEVITFHQERAKITEEKNLQLKKHVFSIIDKIAQKLNAHDRDLYEQAVGATTAILRKHDYDNLTQKEYLLYRYQIKLKDFHNTNAAKKIMSALEQLPTDTTAPDVLISKQMSDKELLETLISRLQISYDHVRARAYNGGDFQGNGIYMCRHCNNKRGSLSYPFLFHINPKMPQYIQKQVSRLASFITHGKLTNYDDYPFDIKQTLYHETKNRLNLNINQYLKAVKIDSEKTLQNAQVRYDKISLDLKEAEAEYNNLLARLKEAKKHKNDILCAQIVAEDTLAQSADYRDFVNYMIKEDKALTKNK